MKMKLAILALSASLISPIFADDRVLATYKGGNITESQIMNKFSTMLNTQEENKGKTYQQLDPRLQTMLLQGYINSLLLKAEEDKQKIRSSKEYLDTLKMAEEEIAQRILLEKVTKTATTEEDIKKAHEKIVKDRTGQEEHHITHILLNSEQKAIEVKREIETNKTKFDAAARQYSEDKGTQGVGGDLGYVMKGSLVPEFEAAAFKLPTNKLAIVKTQYGYHIIKNLGKRKAVIPTLEKAKVGIMQDLARSAVDKYIKELIKENDVQIKLQPTSVDSSTKGK